MGYHHFAYLFAIAVGLVSSGAIASLWAVATNDSPRLAMLTDGSVYSPLRVPLVVLSAPVRLIGSACWWMFESPLIGFLLLLAGIAWSFFQGVFILTQIFGVT